MSYWTPILACDEFPIPLGPWAVFNTVAVSFFLGFQMLMSRCFPKLRILPAILACGWICVWLIDGLQGRWGLDWVHLSEVVFPSCIPVFALLAVMFFEHFAGKRQLAFADSAHRTPRSALP